MADEQQGFASKYLPDLVRLLGAGAGASMAIVPPSIAATFPKMRGFKKPEDIELLREAVKNSGGNYDPKHGLNINVTRFQKPEQAGQRALSGGVFYAPTENTNVLGKSYYDSPNGIFGGSQSIVGDSLFKNPLFVNAPPGNLFGSAGARIYKPSELSKIKSEIWGAQGNPDPEILNQIGNKYFPEVGIPSKELYNEKNFRLWPWMTESALGSKARSLGYDSVVPYDQLGMNKSLISEIFDLREMKYPGPSGEYSLWPQYKQY